MYAAGPASIRYAQGSSFAVAAGCPEAVAAALDVLRDRGTIVDAAIAASAVMAVALPHASTIGGDLFALLRPPDGQGPAVAVNSSGGAPAAATLTAYANLGLSRVPRVGPLSIQTPGLVAGWQLLADRWASLPLSVLLEPAISLARGGVRVGSRLATTIAASRLTLQDVPGWAELFVPHGRPLMQGDLLTQTNLAETLDRIGRHGAAAFYSGEIARSMARAVRSAGGLLIEADLAAMRPEFARPLHISCWGSEIITQPPVSQGFVLLRALALIRERLATRASHPEHEVWLEAANALLLAFQERLAVLGDHPTALNAAKTLLKHEPGDPRAFSPYDATPTTNTTALSLAASDGSAISIIQSIYGDLGSGLLDSDTGVLLNNRLSSFFLDPAYPNCLAPRKRSMHTLHTFMVNTDSRLSWVGASPGGDLQPQVNLQVLLRLLLLQETAADAINSPRWALSVGTSPHDPSPGRAPVHIVYEPGVSSGVIESLRRAGYSMSESQERLGSSHLLAVGSHPDPPVRAWFDDRREGQVAAL